MIDSLRRLAELAEGRGALHAARHLYKAAESLDKEPYVRYNKFLAKWYLRLNNAPEDSPERWLVESMRKHLPDAHKKTWKEDPKKFHERVANGLSIIKQEAESEETRKGLWMKWMQDALKVVEALNVGRI